MSSPVDAPLRCLLQQSALPSFRVPFHRELGRRDGLELEVLYGTKALPNAEASGLRARHRSIRRIPPGLYWDGAHLRQLREQRYDAVSLIWNVRYLSLVPALLLARRRGAGTVLWGHGYSKDEGRVRAWARRAVARLADGIVLYSDAVAERYVDAGFDPQRVFVARNTLDQAPIQAARGRLLERAGSVEDFRRRHGLDGGPVFLFVSRLYAENRVDLLLEAAAELRRSHPGLRVVVIGTGPDEQRLRARAHALGVEDLTRFLGAVYEEDELAPWFVSASAFVYPQNIGLSILHAFGYGLPVVTSDRRDAQNPEIEALRDGENGLLYRHASVEDLVATLRRVADDDELRTRLGREAHRTAVQDYPVSAMADGMEAALRAAARRARTRTRRRAGR